MVITLTFTGELAVMLPAGLVAAHHAGDLLPVLVLGAGALVVRALLGDVTGRDRRHRGPEPGGHGPRVTGTEAATEGVVQGQRGHGHRGDGGGRGQEAGVPPDRGWGRHQGHVGHQAGHRGQQTGVRRQGARETGVENDAET